MNRKEQSQPHGLNHDASFERDLAVFEHGSTVATKEILFTTDRIGDVQNLRYGSIDRYKVPKYRLTGHGRLIGLDRRYKILSGSSTERRVEDLSLDSSSKSQSFTSILKHQLVDDSPMIKSELTGRDDFIEQQNFVRFGRKRRRLSSRDKLAQHDAATPPHSNSSSESDVSMDDSTVDHHNSTSDAFEQLKNHPDSKKVIELRKKTERDPQNVDAWLQLIDHQENYFKLTLGDGRQALSSSQRQVVSDLKVSLYERAIASVKSPSSKEKLILGLMKEGSKIWDMDRQAKEWKSILDRMRSVDLWYEYLNFQQTNAIAFSFDKTLETYVDIFKAVSDLDEEDRDLRNIYLVLRLTKFMHEAGFAERAIAIWQSLIEFNLLSPPAGRNDLHEYETFWDSECARVGEEGAQGWHRGSEKEVPPRQDEPCATFQPEFLFSDWTRAEQTRSARDLLPARTLDETIEDDPFRVVLFSDVEEFLFRVSTSDSRSLLTQAFLKFCGLPANINARESSREWWVDPFLCDFDPDLRVGALADVNALFASSGSALEMWNLPAPELQSTSHLQEFAVRALTLLAENPLDDWMAEYLIAFQLQANRSQVRKVARSMSKRRPNSLLLYNTFGLVEARSGRLESADNVWTTALSMSASLGPAEQRHKMVLWHSWIWELMEQRRYESARRLLVEAVPLEALTVEALRDLLKRTNHSTMQQLRAKEYFRSQIADALTTHNELIVELTGLFATLQYLLQNHQLEATIDVYQSSLSLLNKTFSPKVVERLHQLLARHAHYHATSSPHGYRPLQLIPLFQESHAIFPNNSIFFRLLNLYSHRAGAIDRVRTFDIKQGLSMGAMSCLYAISKEVSGNSTLGSTTHSIRRVFAKATASDSVFRHCSGVWLCWIQWESSLAQKQTKPDLKPLRQVCFSALSCCPWAKDLYLQGFGRRGNALLLPDKDLEQIYRSMSERGLRIRHDITDLLDKTYSDDG